MLIVIQHDFKCFSEKIICLLNSKIDYQKMAKLHRTFQSLVCKEIVIFISSEVELCRKRNLTLSAVIMSFWIFLENCIFFTLSF